MDGYFGITRGVVLTPGLDQPDGFVHVPMVFPVSIEERRLIGGLDVIPQGRQNPILPEGVDESECLRRMEIHDSDRFCMPNDHMVHGCRLLIRRSLTGCDNAIQRCFLPTFCM